MTDLFWLFTLVFLTFIGIIGWLLYYTSSLVHRNDTQAQKLFDAMLALVNRQAALTAANMSRVRAQAERSDISPQLDAETLSRAKRRAEVDRMLEEINHTTVLSPEQEKFMEELDRNGN